MDCLVLLFLGLLLLPLLVLQPMPELAVEFWYWTAALIPLEVTAMLLYSQAIRDTSLSLTLPYLAFTPVFNTVTGYVLLQEQVSLIGFAGILLVVFGAWLLNLDHARGERFDALAPFRAIISERGSRLMLVTAAIYSLTSVIGKAALLESTPAFFGALYYVIIGGAALLVFAPRRGRHTLPPVRTLFIQLAIGLCMAVMVITHFYAIGHIEVAYMIAVKRTSLLFGILYSVLLFHERARVEHFLAGGLMLAGVYLIVN